MLCKGNENFLRKQKNKFYLQQECMYKVFFPDITVKDGQMVYLFAFMFFNAGEKYVSEDLWRSGDTVFSRRRGQEELLL